MISSDTIGKKNIIIWFCPFLLFFSVRKPIFRHPVPIFTRNVFSESFSQVGALKMSLFFYFCCSFLENWEKPGKFGFIIFDICFFFCCLILTPLKIIVGTRNVHRKSILNLSRRGHSMVKTLWSFLKLYIGVFSFFELIKMVSAQNFDRRSIVNLTVKKKNSRVTQ